MYGKLNIIDTGKRYFSAWATVDIVDTQGDRVNIDDFQKFIPIFLDRIPPLTLEHSNKIVGKVLNAYPTTDKDGVNGIMMYGRVYEDTSLDDKVWNMIKTGKLKGVSIGGEAMRKDGYLNLAKTWEVSLTEHPANSRAKLLAYNHFAKKIAKDMPANAVPFDDEGEVPEGAKVVEGPKGGKYYLPAGDDEDQRVKEDTSPARGKLKDDGQEGRSVAEEFHVKIIQVAEEFKLPNEIIEVFQRQVLDTISNVDAKKVLENEERFLNILRVHARKLAYYSDRYISKNIKPINEEESMTDELEEIIKEEKEANTTKPDKDNPKPDKEEKPQGEMPPPPPLDLGYDDTEIKGKLANLEAEITKLKGMISPTPVAPKSDNTGDKMEEKPEETSKSEIKKEASMEEIFKSSIDALNVRLENIEKSLEDLKKSKEEDVKKSSDETEAEPKPEPASMPEATQEDVAKTPEVEDSDISTVEKSTEINWNNSKEWNF